MRLERLTTLFLAIESWLVAGSVYVRVIRAEVARWAEKTGSVEGGVCCWGRTRTAEEGAADAVLQGAVLAFGALHVGVE